MKSFRMTGAEVVSVLERSGLTVGELAQLVGVHRVTAQRWKAQKQFACSRLQAQIIVVLDQVLADWGSRRRERFCLKLKETLPLEPVRAVHLILNRYYRLRR